MITGAIRSILIAPVTASLELLVIRESAPIRGTYMLNFFGTDITILAGEASSRSLTLAYEAALLAISGGMREAFPDQQTRLLLVKAMTQEGNTNGFDAERMTRVGLSAVETRTLENDLWTRR